MSQGSAGQSLGPSPEHFDLLRGALDHIAKTARASRSQTRRLRWIELRAETALRGEVYRDQDIDLPKSAGPNTPERLQQRLAQTKAEKRELLAVLQALLDMDVAYQRGPVVVQAVDAARAVIEKVTGVAHA